MQQIFDNARQPKAWMRVAQRLRASADAIFERENPVAARHWEEIRRIGSLPAEEGSPPEDYDENEFPFPRRSAAVLMAEVLARISDRLGREQASYSRVPCRVPRRPEASSGSWTQRINGGGRG